MYVFMHVGPCLFLSVMYACPDLSMYVLYSGVYVFIVVWPIVFITVCLPFFKYVSCMCVRM